MRIAVNRRPSWTVLTLDGDLNLEASPGVYLSFQRELRRGTTHVLFDLALVHLVDTSGLGVLVRCYKDAKRHGGEVGLTRVPGPIGRILEYTRLDSILPLRDEDPPPPSGPDAEAA